MTARPASLPMYDVDRAAVQAWWQGVLRALREEGVFDAPGTLAWPDDLQAHWRDPRLLLSQTCGYPLVTTLGSRVQVVGAMAYTAPGGEGIGYRSALVAREDDGAAIEDFRGRVAVVNAPDSHSGSNALRGVVAPLARGGRFFGGTRVSGSHRQSLQALQDRSADVAAIDGITLAGLRRHRPAQLAGLRVFGWTPVAPGLPLVTAAATSAPTLRALQRALLAACADPALATRREALFIGGFEVVPASAWQPVDDLRIAAARALEAED